MGRTRAIGYDMQVVHKDPEEEGLFLAVEFDFREKVRTRYDEPRTAQEWLMLQEAIENSLWELEQAQPSVFYLSIWEMSLARTLMEDLGLLDMTVTTPGHLSPDNYGVTPEMHELDFDQFPEALMPPQLVAFREARTRALDSAVISPVGIPYYKLGSNDGWLVTPEEITAGLARCTTAADKYPEIEWWKPWIVYLGYATSHGGFRVW